MSGPARAALVLLVLGAALWWLLGPSGNPAGETETDPEGIDFVVPPEYEVMDLGEATPSAAAARLLEKLPAGRPVAAVFTFEGDRIQWLADSRKDLLDERVFGRNGTVHRVLWPDSLETRLRRARSEGKLDVPGLPPPDRRNPYH